MPPFNDSSWRIVRTIAIMTVLAASLYYVHRFHAYFENNEWEHVSGFTRILIPDTFLYAALVNEADFLSSFLLSGVKNSIGPSAIWLFAGFNWYVVSLINVVFAYFIVIYFEKNCKFYGITRALTQRSVLIFIISPATVYYTVGALKELPMMLFILMTLYYVNKRAWVLAGCAALMLIVFRYQMVVLMLLMAMAALLGFRNKIPKGVIAFLVVAAAIYPALEGLDILAQGVTIYFRQEYGQQGSFGSMIESIRSNVFIISIFAVLFRALQSFFEPVLTFLGRGGSFFEDGSFSVFDFVQFFTVLLFIPFSWRAASRFVYVLRGGAKAKSEVQMLYGFLAASLLLVGGFSFIHHRYLYPFFPLLLIAGSIPYNRLVYKKAMPKQVN